VQIVAAAPSAIAVNAPERPAARARLARRVRRELGLAPPVPRDWVTGPPDFVGVGAQRSGTTWWFGLIAEHPAAHAARKEQHFFDRFAERPFEESDAAAYAARFPRPARAVTGEWTPRYMHDFWTPALLRRAAPDAKLVVLLRDPWARYLSGVAHEVRALRRELRFGKRVYLNATIADDALDRSLYARQLARLFEHFERSRVLVLQYERCCAEPVTELRRTCEFLGLDPASCHARQIGRSAWRPADAVESPRGSRSAVAATIEADLDELRTLAPELDFALWPSAARLRTRGQRAA
jgi:hypothetical protein